MFVQILLSGLAVYLVCGVAFAMPFAAFGAKQIDPHAAHGSWGFRVLILPGTVFLWPLLAKRWLSGAGVPPEERNAHRRAAREAA